MGLEPDLLWPVLAAKSAPTCDVDINPAHSVQSKGFFTLINETKLVHVTHKFVRPATTVEAAPASIKPM